MIEKIKSFFLGLIVGIIGFFLFLKYRKSETVQKVLEKEKEIKDQVNKIKEEIKNVDNEIKKVDDKLKNIPEDEQWHLKR
jgi:F0F1-type ATP synthase membrane subunit b/b'